MSDLMNISPQFFGISMVPKESWRDYGFALLTIAGSDGMVSDPELEWLTIDLARSVNVDEEIIADWEEFAYESADLEEIFFRFDKSSIASFNKVLIYDAIRMCSADGEYAEEERALVAEAARILHIGRESVVAIEALVQLEQAANVLRMTLL